MKITKKGEELVIEHDGAVMTLPKTEQLERMALFYLVENNESQEKYDLLVTARKRPDDGSMDIYAATSEGFSIIQVLGSLDLAKEKFMQIARPVKI